VRRCHVKSKTTTTPSRKVDVTGTVVRAIKEEPRLQRNPSNGPTALDSNPLCEPVVTHSRFTTYLAAKCVIPKHVHDTRTAWGRAGGRVQLGLPIPKREKSAEARVIHESARLMRGQAPPETDGSGGADALDPHRRGTQGGSKELRKEDTICRSGKGTLGNRRREGTERRRPVLTEVCNLPINNRRRKRGKTSKKKGSRCHQAGKVRAKGVHLG
jgi:hypothetical protein